MGHRALGAGCLGTPVPTTTPPPAHPPRKKPQFLIDPIISVRLAFAPDSERAAQIIDSLAH